MKWSKFIYKNKTHYGYVIDHNKIQPTEAKDILDIINGNIVFSSDPINIDKITIMAPFQPKTIVCVGLNYMDHCGEQNIDIPKSPVLFSKQPDSIIGHLEEIEWSTKVTNQVDYEVELGLVIGKVARNVNEESAMDYIFGYVPANDVSARDLQFKDGQWFRGKSLDTFCPIGPFIVTKDEVKNPQELSLKCRINGVTYQDSNTNKMIFSIKKLISFISHSFTLYPGDLILTGTPDGVGYFREPQIFLKSGDKVEIEIEKLGLLENTVG